MTRIVGTRPPTPCGDTVFVTSWWAPWVVMSAAVGIRLIGLDAWSLWEDEETTIFFSLHPDRPFPRAFPLFFVLLGKLYAVTGVSVGAGRLLAAAIGVATLWLTYRLALRFTNPRVALAALVLVSVSPAHIFWSQSIRYYGMVLALQLVSIHWFLAGLSSGRMWLLASSNVPLLLALNSHFSAILLVPVYVVYLAWLGWREGLSPVFWRRIVAFGVPAALMIALWLRPLVAMSGMLGGWVVPSARDPIHVLLTAAFYYGPPAFLLGIVGLWSLAARAEVPFFAFLAAVPLLELGTLAILNVVNVTYYYGFASLIGVAILGGYGWDVVLSRSRFGLGRVVIVGVALLFYVPVLFAYFGKAHGDRPRWKEAAIYLRGEVGNPPCERIFASVPGTIAHHLGIDPGATMGHPLVRGFSDPHAFTRGNESTWYVSEARVLTPAARAFLDGACHEAARFPASMLTRDRTVVVFRCAGAGHGGMVDNPR